MTIYSDIGPALVDVFVDPYFTELSTITPTCYRTTPGTPSQAATQATDGARTLAIIPAAAMREASTLPAVLVWDTPFYALADIDEDIQADDVYTDSARAFVIKQQPNLDFGLLIAPASPCEAPS